MPVGAGTIQRMEDFAVGQDLQMTMSCSDKVSFFKQLIISSNLT